MNVLHEYVVVFKSEKASNVVRNGLIVPWPISNDHFSVYEHAFTAEDAVTQVRFRVSAHYDDCIITGVMPRG